MDLLEEFSGETSLGGADVAANSGPIGEQPATRKVAGCCSIDIDLASLSHELAKVVQTQIRFTASIS
jgi:hypothetical protein